MTSATPGAGLSATRCPVAEGGDLELTATLARLRKDLNWSNVKPSARNSGRHSSDRSRRECILPHGSLAYAMAQMDPRSDIAPVDTLSTVNYPGRMRTSRTRASLLSPSIVKAENSPANPYRSRGPPGH